MVTAMPAIRSPSSPMHAHARGLLAGLIMVAMAVPAWAATTVATPGAQVIGYVTQWSPAQDAQLRMIDTLIFAFAEVHDARVVLKAEAAARLRTIVALKALDPRLRVEISIGGWGAG